MLLSSFTTINSSRLSPITIAAAPRACLRGYDRGDLCTYGPVSEVPSRHLGTQTVQYGFPDTPLAVWGTDDYSVTLLRVTYPQSFRLVVADTRLENLARTATTTAVRLNTEEAPQREIARQKKEAAASAAAQEKAKTENKAQFRP